LIAASSVAACLLNWITVEGSDMPPVTGDNPAGNGVTGSGSQYGVYGSSTATFAGVAGFTTSSAPGVYGESGGTGPGILAISSEVTGVAELASAINQTTLDQELGQFATKAATAYQGQAAIFAGDVAVTNLGLDAAVTLSATDGITAPSATLTSDTATALQATSTSGKSASLAGDVEVSKGSVTIATGDLTVAKGDVTVAKGDVTVAKGDVTVAKGNLTVTKGSTTLDKVTVDSLTATGDVTARDVFLSGADCAEEFACATQALEPGTVVIADADGLLTTTDEPYCPGVVGVISGAGRYRPAIVLDHQEGDSNRAPVALAGKVFCKVDGSFSPVRVGDLLTTSPNPGYAMRATEASRAWGTVLGKALAPLGDSQGLIPILVMMR
jgi:hypothetical protein